MKTTSIKPLVRLISFILVMFGGFGLLKAAPGDLDPTFAGGGKYTFGFGNQNAYPAATAVQADGKIVVTGTNGSNYFSVLRYNPDGSRDTSFAGDGEVETAVAPLGADYGVAYAYGLTVQNDGKIVVVGATQGATAAGLVVNFAMVRYNPDGSLDNSFGAGGKVTTSFGGSGDIASSVTVLADGKILVAGNHFQGNNEFYYALARYNTNGSLDNTFNGTGKVTTFIGVLNGAGFNPVGMVVFGDRIYLAGTVSGNQALNGFRVRAYTLGGAPDPTFGANGQAVIAVSSKDTAHSIAIQAGNNTFTSLDKIVVGGTSFDGMKNVFSVMRFNLTGSLDTTLNNTGYVLTPIPNFTSAGAVAVAVEHRGITRKIVLAGSGFRPAGSPTLGDIAVLRLNSDGKPDSTFGANGLVTTSLGRYDEATALNLVSDGKILVTGDSARPLPASDRDLSLIRYNTDGTLDATLDGDGKELDDIGPRGFGARSVVLQPDGKIVVCGSGTVSSGTSLARLNSDGTLDLSFDEDGKIALTDFTDESANAVALQSDGKIVVAGSRLNGSDDDFVVTRYNANGSRDTSFGGGRVTESVTTGDDVALAVAVQSDGKIITTGYGTGSSKRDTALMRFNTGGDLDDSFGTDGVVFVSLGIGNNEARALALQPDGKIVVAGVADGPLGKRFFAARFKSSGALDPSFNNGEGVAYVRFASGPAEATSLALDAGGRLVLAGFVSNGSNYDFAVARLTPSGLPDTTFGNSGQVVTPIGTADDRANAVVVQSDGKILVAGNATSNSVLGQLPQQFPVERGSYALVRYRTDGSLDPSYGTGGLRLLQMESGEVESANALVLDAQSRAIVVGNAAYMFGVARLTPGSLGPEPTPTPTPVPTRLANISTRLRVESGEGVLIGGFIVTGTQPKKVIIRAIGPSLPFADTLADPTIELYGPNGLIEANDNWGDSPNRQAIIDSTVPPSHNLESAIVATLPANNSSYTAVVRGAGDGTGVGVVEVYDLDSAANSKLANIATRGLVQTGDNILIAGTIVLGEQPQRVIVRAIGPSLPIPGKLENPLLELRDGNGAVLEANDNWIESANKQAIIETTIPPVSDLEAAIVATLPAAGASYTAVVRGANDSIGIAVIEVYALH